MRRKGFLKYLVVWLALAGSVGAVWLRGEAFAAADAHGQAGPHRGAGGNGGARAGEQ